MGIIVPGPARSYGEETVEFMGEKYTCAKFDSPETRIFDEQLRLLIGAPDSLEQRLFQLRREALLIGVRSVKYKLDNPAFRGFYAGDNELAWGLIRPQYVCAGGTYASPTAKSTWVESVTTSWADWIYSAAGTAYNLGKVDEDYGMVVLYLKSLLTSPGIPAVSEVRFELDRKKTSVFDVRSIRLADNFNQVYVYPVPSLILLPKIDFYARLIGDVAQSEEVALGGVAVGLGRVLKTE